MAKVVDVKVPDIGDFKDVPVIELLVAAGDEVAVDDPLVTLESDKATIELPSPYAGRVRDLMVAVGDTVSEGALILQLETGEGAEAAAAKEKVREDATPATSDAAGYGSDSGVYESVEVRVPDIGDYKDVPVIELLVAAGDEIAAEDPIVTLESDKATMEVPAPVGGVVEDLEVAVGDTVSEGSLLLMLRTGEGPVRSPPAPATESRPSAPASGDIHAEMLVLGSGPGGYTAAFRAADLGLETVLVERYPRLGGVCLNVGCIPSKALLHAAKVITEAEEMSEHGLAFAKPSVDLDKLRGWKQGVVERLTGGLAGLSKQRKVRLVRGVGSFASSHLLSVEGEDGATTVSFDQAIIAAGSRVVELPFIPHDDPRVIDSTGALELADVPARLLVIGGGIIGLEMATV